MKRRSRTFALVLVAAVGVLLLWSLRLKVEDAGGGETPQASQEAAPAAPPNSGTEPALSRTAELPGSPATAGPVPIASVPEAVEALLRSSNVSVRFHEVPELDPATQVALAQRYEQQPSLAEKRRIARVLAFARSPLIVPLITNTVTRGYSGVRITAQEEGRLLGHLSLLGVVAPSDDAALDFLLAGSSSEFWKEQKLWEVEGRRRIGDWAIIGECIHALGISQRPEALEFLDRLRDDPGRVIELGAEGALADTAFCRDMIAECGWERAIDERIFSGEESNRWSVQWRASSNGVWWDHWMDNVERLKRERREGSR